MFIRIQSNRVGLVMQSWLFKDMYFVANWKKFIIIMKLLLIICSKSAKVTQRPDHASVYQ